jgi:hypothetical protein
MAAGPSIEELRAEARYADQRLALYRRKVLLGRGDARRLAELERIADGAGERLRRRLLEGDPAREPPQPG